MFRLQITTLIFNLGLSSLLSYKIDGNLKNRSVCREVTQRQRELIEEFDKECADRDKLVAATG
jgi:uncharacterized membrane protein